MDLFLAIISDTFWFTPTLLVMFTFTALLAEVIGRRSPIPAGASPLTTLARFARPQLDNFDAQLVLRLLITVGVAVATCIAARAVAKGHDPGLVNGVMFTGSCIAMGLALWTWRLLAPWKQAQVGVASEREVGRDLQLLMLDGCRVFHHLVDERVGDIDHIIVAPHAIFLVETHTATERTKGLAAPAARVAYNGRELIFTHRRTDAPVKTAAAKARWLNKHLKHKTGIGLPVIPIVALPGWEVQQTGNGDVHVVNPRNISSIVVDKAATPMYDAQRQKLINFLDEQCQYAPF